MIEVEIRGRLTKKEFDRLKKFLTKNGEFIEHRDREIYLLYDYPGFNLNPTAREVDIRLRNTNGNCEIMVKKKASDGNIGRKEISLKLQDMDLDKAKEVVKALGCKKALRMHRVTDIFTYENVEWALVKTPKDYFYFEAEKVTEKEKDIKTVHKELVALAKELDLKVFSQKETEQFIYFLDREVNVEVEL